MLILRKRSFAVFLFALMTISPLLAADSVATSEVIGSIESHGPVQLGDVRMPSVGTLFAGDRVATNNGVALIRYTNGAQIVLASESRANFAPGQVQLEIGLMTFESAFMHGVAFSVSSIRMEPTSPKIIGSITLRENKVGIAVTQGTLQITDASGVELALMKGGEARSFGVPSIGNLTQPVHARNTNKGAEALELFLAGAQQRAAVLLREAKRLSIYTEGATTFSEIAITIERLEAMQRQLAQGVGPTAQTASQLNAIITTLNSANASLRPCETPAAVKAASPSRVFRSCH